MEEMTRTMMGMAFALQVFLPVIHADLDQCHPSDVLARCLPWRSPARPTPRSSGSHTTIHHPRKQYRNYPGIQHRRTLSRSSPRICPLRNLEITYERTRAAERPKRHHSQDQRSSLPTLQGRMGLSLHGRGP